MSNKGGVNGSFKFSTEDSKLSEPSNRNKRKANYSELQLSIERKLSHASRQITWRKNTSNINKGSRGNQWCSMATGDLFDQFVLLHKDYDWLEGLWFNIEDKLSSPYSPRQLVRQPMPITRGRYLKAISEPLQTSSSRTRITLGLSRNRHLTA